MKVDCVGIIAILSMSHIPICIVQIYTSMSKIPVENQITTLSVLKIAIKYSPYGQEGERVWKFCSLVIYFEFI